MIKWEPIETAPFNKTILCAWFDDDVLDDVALVTIHSINSGLYKWFNVGSGNYVEARYVNSNPTHWTEL